MIKKIIFISSAIFASFCYAQPKRVLEGDSIPFLEYSISYDGNGGTVNPDNPHSYSEKYSWNIRYEWKCLGMGS